MRATVYFLFILAVTFPSSSWGEIKCGPNSRLMKELSSQTIDFLNSMNVEIKGTIRNNPCGRDWKTDNREIFKRVSDEVSGMMFALVQKTLRELEVADTRLDKDRQAKLVEELRALNDKCPETICKFKIDVQTTKMNLLTEKHQNGKPVVEKNAEVISKIAIVDRTSGNNDNTTADFNEFLVENHVLGSPSGKIRKYEFDFLKEIEMENGRKGVLYHQDGNLAECRDGYAKNLYGKCEKVMAPAVAPERATKDMRVLAHDQDGKPRQYAYMADELIGSYPFEYGKDGENPIGISLKEYRDELDEIAQSEGITKAVTGMDSRPLETSAFGQSANGCASLPKTPYAYNFLRSFNADGNVEVLNAPSSMTETMKGQSEGCLDQKFFFDDNRNLYLAEGFLKEQYGGSYNDTGPQLKYEAPAANTSGPGTYTLALNGSELSSSTTTAKEDSDAVKKARSTQISTEIESQEVLRHAMFIESMRGVQKNKYDGLGLLPEDIERDGKSFKYTLDDGKTVIVVDEDGATTLEYKTGALHDNDKCKQVITNYEELMSGDPDIASGGTKIDFSFSRKGVREPLCIHTDGPVGKIIKACLTAVQNLYKKLTPSFSNLTKKNCTEGRLVANNAPPADFEINGSSKPCHFATNTGWETIQFHNGTEWKEMAPNQMDQVLYTFADQAGLCQTAANPDELKIGGFKAEDRATYDEIKKSANAVTTIENLSGQGTITMVETSNSIHFEVKLPATGQVIKVDRSGNKEYLSPGTNSQDPLGFCFKLIKEPQWQSRNPANQPFVDFLDSMGGNINDPNFPKVKTDASVLGTLSGNATTGFTISIPKENIDENKKYAECLGVIHDKGRLDPIYKKCDQSDVTKASDAFGVNSNTITLYPKPRSTIPTPIFQTEYGAEALEKVTDFFLRNHLLNKLGICKVDGSTPLPTVQGGQTVTVVADLGSNYLSNACNANNGVKSNFQQGSCVVKTSGNSTIQMLVCPKVGTACPTMINAQSGCQPFKQVGVGQ